MREKVGGLEYDAGGEAIAIKENFDKGKEL